MIRDLLFGDEGKPRYWLWVATIVFLLGLQLSWQLTAAEGEARLREAAVRRTAGTQALSQARTLEGAGQLPEAVAKSHASLAMLEGFPEFVEAKTYHDVNRSRLLSQRSRAAAKLLKEADRTAKLQSNRANPVQQLRATLALACQIPRESVYFPRATKLVALASVRLTKRPVSPELASKCEAVRNGLLPPGDL